jgi:hypothetical protein
MILDKQGTDASTIFKMGAVDETRPGNIGLRLVRDKFRTPPWPARRQFHVIHDLLDFAAPRHGVPTANPQYVLPKCDRSGDTVPSNVWGNRRRRSLPSLTRVCEGLSAPLSTLSGDSSRSPASPALHSPFLSLPLSRTHKCEACLTSIYHH